jgi:hypothetical protein
MPRPGRGAVARGVDAENLLSKIQPMNGMEMIPDRSIAVAGAGSIGCFVGGMWAWPAARSHCWRGRA